jgi:hypothetical protein
MGPGVYSLSPEEMLRLRGGSPAFTAGLNQSMQQPQTQAPQMQQMPQQPQPAQMPQQPQQQPFNLQALMQQYGGGMGDGNYKLKMKDGMIKKARGFEGMGGGMGGGFGMSAPRPGGMGRPGGK